jgi:UDP-glucose 4-epimerase
MSLSSAKILVTGGAGLVGSAIVDQLVALGAEVTVYDSFIRGKMEHLAQARSRGNVRIISADLRDREKLRDAIRGMDYGCRWTSISAARSTCSNRASIQE